MRLSDSNLLAALPALEVEWHQGASLAERTSLGIGGATDLLLIRRHSALPDLVKLLDAAGVPFRFLGGGTNLLVRDGIWFPIDYNVAFRTDDQPAPPAEASRIIMNWFGIDGALRIAAGCAALGAAACPREKS